MRTQANMLIHIPFTTPSLTSRRPTLYVYSLRPHTWCGKGSSYTNTMTELGGATLFRLLYFWAPGRAGLAAPAACLAASARVVASNSAILLQPVISCKTLRYCLSSMPGAQR